ncbi:Transmembrane secretion effector [Lentzea xinjiangensis]|uniref:Transmembrane secretion effector n=1 Tax=Lentzea xinjiangensis TaxID=402600 RepID=A0A1H9WM95_9PSEU|nr:MFS transporter [Lentzea xinjiangensis]SES35020.1 Transmembrane secretion effector [Lentzea xinjiangensis]
MIRELLADRDTRRYFVGQTFSLFGDTSMWLAAGIWVKQLTGSDAAAGMTYFFFALPAVAAPLFGLLVDRVRRRRLLIGVNLAGALVVLSLLGVAGPEQLWLLYAVMVLYGCCECLVGAAQQALLATFVPTRLLADANATLRTIREGLRIVAPLAGAALFAWAGGAAIAVVDAITFLVAAWCLWRMRIVEPRPERTPGTRMAAELAAGFRFLTGKVDLRRLTIGAAVAMTVFGFTESAVYAVLERGLQKPPEFFGVLASVQGVGSVVGGVTAALLLRRRAEHEVVAAGLVASAIGVLCWTLPSLPAVLAGAAAGGLGLPWIVIGALTLLQRRAPNNLQGRVYTSFDVTTTVPQTASIALGASLITVLDHRVLLIAEAVVLLLSTALVLRIRTADRTRLDPEVSPCPTT